MFSFSAIFWMNNVAAQHQVGSTPSSSVRRTLCVCVCVFSDLCVSADLDSLVVVPGVQELLRELERQTLLTDPFHPEHTAQTGRAPVQTALAADHRRHACVTLLKHTRTTHMTDAITGEQNLSWRTELLYSWNWSSFIMDEFYNINSYFPVYYSQAALTQSVWYKLLYYGNSEPHMKKLIKVEVFFEGRNDLIFGRKKVVWI